MIRPRRTKFRPIVEGLDDRCLPSVAGLTPAQVATAYGLSGLTFGTRAANGSGQKIAIVDAYNDPNIKTELAVFDSAFNLPRPPSLTVVGQTGTSALPSNDAVWALEEALDVEWAHALAPGASIVLVEANSASVPDLMAAVNVAKRISRVSVIAMSWGASEFSGETAYDSVFTTPGVTFVAGSGDNGSFGGPLWPASSPNVLAVGGTTLQVNTSGNYLGETAWSGSGGGISTIEQATQLSSLGPVHRRAEHARRGLRRRSHHRGPDLLAGFVDYRRGHEPRHSGVGRHYRDRRPGACAGQRGDPRVHADADRPLQPPLVRLPHRWRCLQYPDGPGLPQRRRPRQRLGVGSRRKAATRKAAIIPTVCSRAAPGTPSLGTAPADSVRYHSTRTIARSPGPPGLGSRTGP